MVGVDMRRQDHIACFRYGFYLHIVLRAPKIPMAYFQAALLRVAGLSSSFHDTS